MQPFLETWQAGLRRGIRRRRTLASLRIWSTRFAFWLGAVIVGLAAAAFAELTEDASRWFVASAAALPWLPFLLAPAMGAVGVFLTRRYFVGAEGSGIPQVIAELEHGGKPGWRPLVSLRIVVGKIGLGVAAVGCGFSMGREGPTVQIGSSLMAMIAPLLRSSQIQRRHVLVAGAAAGIAAAFNAPLAGIVFAIEEMNRGVESRMSGVVITAIILAGVVAQTFMGTGSYFGHAPTVVAGMSELFEAVLASALVCGLAGGLFARIITTAAGNWQGPVARLRSRRPYVFAALCGLLIAGIGWATDGASYCSGYDQTRHLLDSQGDLPWHFGPAKFIATAVSYLSGLPGGLFAPSLAIGAGIGNDLAPFMGFDGRPAAILVLCMAGFLAAVTQAPITSFVIVMEMVDGYGLVTGLMAVTLLSTGISRLLCRPLYHTLAQRIAARQLPADEPETAGQEHPAAEAVADPGKGETAEQVQETEGAATGPADEAEKVDSAERVDRTDPAAPAGSTGKA